MALIRWDPFREMSSLQERMNRLFSDVLSRTPFGEEEMIRRAWVPAVDIYEHADSIVILAELPGVTKEDVSLEVRDNTLTLKGEKKIHREVKEENCHRVERSYGFFQRSFSLPNTIRQEKVSAKFKDGILEIVLPRAEEAKPKQIKVDVS